MGRNKKPTTNPKTKTGIASNNEVASSHHIFKYPDIDFSQLPLRDVYKYQVQELCPGVLIVDDVFSEKECQLLRQASSPFLSPTNPKNTPPKKGEAFRNNERFKSQCEQENITFVNKLWEERLKPIILSPKNLHFLELEILSSMQSARMKRDKLLSTYLPVGLNSDVKFYRYRKDAEFQQHVDEPVLKTVQEKKLISEFTVLFYIGAEQGLKGGETKFWLKNQPINVEPKVGRVCLHWTGKDCRHSGEKVERGEKYVMRTDLFYHL